MSNLSLTKIFDKDDNTGEIWKSVIGYEDTYEVSNLGNIRSLKRKINHSRRGYNQRNSVYHHFKGEYNQYVCFGLWKNGVCKQVPLHRLVAQAFIPNPENKPFVNHIDGDRRNNNVENLEWCTAKENADHAIRTGLNKLTGFGEKVYCIETSTIYSSIREASKRTQCSYASIRRSCLLGCSTMSGYTFKRL